MMAKIAVVLAIVLFSATISAEETTATSTQSQNRMKYKVNSGDTLGSIALQFKVALADVRAWNNLKSDHVKPGDELIVRSATTITAKPVKAVKRKPRKKRVIKTYKVRRGDTYEKIAKRYKVSIKQLKRWNPRINPRKLQINQKIKLNATVSTPRLKKLDLNTNQSVSWGRASYGRLYNGMTLKSTSSLDVRNEERAWGTRHTIRMLEAGAADVKARWSDATPLHVGDISHPTGGHMRPHKSHQSGRDADVSYYYKGNVHLPGFEDMSEETFDAVKNWHLFKTLIDTGQVEYLFIDYRLQKILYEYAVSIGYQPSQLKPIIQYPHGRSARGIIRHTKGHLNHWHIRFRCDSSDKYCQ